MNVTLNLSPYISTN